MIHLLLRFLKSSLVVILFGCIFVQPVLSLQEEEKETISVFEAVSPSVVFIKNSSLQWDWFSSYVYETPQGAGSGFVWDEEGHIVTSFHVIYQANKIDVIFSDQKVYSAQIVGFSPEHDLAVLKVDAPKELLKPIGRGNSGNLKVGQKALAIGNPFGLDYSLSVGVVSALGRKMQSATGRQIYDVIQTDAAINPGNSGGPVVDSSGDLMGVATAIYSPSGASAGVGFAIPADTVSRVVPQLIKYGKVKRVGLNVVLVPDYMCRKLGIKGAMILEAQPKGAADKAGLRSTRRNFMKEIIYGDIIIAMDDKIVDNNEDLGAFLETKNIGDSVDVKFIRQEKEYATTVVLQELQK